MLQHRFLKAISMLLTSSAYFLALLLPRKFSTTRKKCLPHFQFQFVHWVFELWISDELQDLRTAKEASLQLLHGQSWKSLAQESEAVTILVQSLAWLSRAWCAAVGRVFCLCPPEGRWWRSFLCKAPIPPAKASPSSCNAENGPYYPTCTKKHDFKLIPFRHNHPELLDLNTSCH